MKLITFDTETTALVPGQICQLSYLITENGETTGKNMFFAVDEMSEGSFEVHGFSLEALDELSGGDRFADRADEIFADFSTADMWIGHNVAADDKFLRAEMERLGMKLPKIKLFCTQNYFQGIMMMKRKYQTGRPKPPKLVELAEFMELTDEIIGEASARWFEGGAQAHDARFDAAMTFLCVSEGTKKGMLRGVI